MKHILVIALSGLSAAGLAGCQAARSGAGPAAAPSALPSTVPATGSSSTSWSTAPASPARMSKEAADAARNVSLDDIDISKPMPAGDLKKAFTANAADWQGRKIAVTGAFSMHMTSSSVLDGSSAYRTQVKGSDKEPAVACLSKQRPKEWEVTQNRKDFSRDVVFVLKGVVVDINLDHVALEPCEIVSAREQ